MHNCAECGVELPPPNGTRPKLFCTRTCFLKNYKKRAFSKPVLQEAPCDRCGKIFHRNKRHQRYCSEVCYAGAWAANNPEKNAERTRKRRASKPEWYAANEPKYYRTYRSKSLSKRPWKYLLNSRRSEAKKRNLAFDLTDEWAAARWTGCCEITGISFRPNGTKGPHPFSPSLDKIDPKLGYIKNNCRFILWGCNAIKGVGTDEDMFEIAKAITRQNSPHVEGILALPG